MTSRGRAARALADHLTATTGTAVTAGWDNPAGRPGHGHWRVEWTDGPTTTAMRAAADGHARFLRPLDAGTLTWARQHSPAAWAAALLTRAANNTLPDTPSHAVALIEYDLHDTDTTTWTPATMRAAAELARRHDGDPRRIAAALLTTGAMKPRNETPPSPASRPPASTPARCAHCATAMPTPAATGRPARWCSPACRTRAWRKQRGHRLSR
jgi:hypothetical protein